MTAVVICAVRLETTTIEHLPIKMPDVKTHPPLTVAYVHDGRVISEHEIMLQQLGFQLQQALSLLALG